jgi:endosialidase-like protein
VRIGTATPANVFTVAQGAGPAVADGWSVYSSGRWKANIHALDSALDKVEQLRGVWYELKANGKHEVGLMAEEVGKVVPEVVTWGSEWQERPERRLQPPYRVAHRAHQRTASFDPETTQADRVVDFADENPAGLSKQAVEAALRYAR